MIYHSQPKITKEWMEKSSKGNEHWTISLYDNGMFKCNCPSYSFGAKHFCKHTQSKRLETESLYGSVNNYIKMLKEYNKEL